MSSIFILEGNMLCYITAGLLITVGVIFLAIVFCKIEKITHSSRTEIIFYILICLALIYTGVFFIIKNTDTLTPIEKGLTAMETLEAGTYSSLEELDELVESVHKANRFLRKAKENRYPFWNGVFMEKYENYDYIPISVETMQSINEKAKTWLTSSTP